MRSVGLVVLLLTLSWPASATELDRGCQTAEQREHQLVVLRENLLRVLGPIERVPPSEAEFIRTETEAAIESESEGRFNLIAENPYYHPLAVHDSSASVLDSISLAIEQGSVKRQTVTLIAVLAEFTNLTSAVEAYLDFDWQRTPRIVAPKERGQLIFMVHHSRLGLKRLLICSVDLLQDP